MIMRNYVSQHRSIILSYSQEENNVNMIPEFLSRDAYLNYLLLKSLGNLTDHCKSQIKKYRIFYNEGVIIKAKKKPVRCCLKDVVIKNFPLTLPLLLLLRYYSEHKKSLETYHRFISNLKYPSPPKCTTLSTIASKSNFLIPNGTVQYTTLFPEPTTQSIYIAQASHILLNFALSRIFIEVGLYKSTSYTQITKTIFRNNYKERYLSPSSWPSFAIICIAGNLCCLSTNAGKEKITSADTMAKHNMTAACMHACILHYELYQNVNLCVPHRNLPVFAKFSVVDTVAVVVVVVVVADVTLDVAVFVANDDRDRLNA
uniref:Uncharacterized protein n=1 Tax=Glossina brevipalpis TaxID=37001 RepID=A0A1A9W0G2_9MUSC